MIKHRAIMSILFKRFTLYNAVQADSIKALWTKDLAKRYTDSEVSNYDV